MSEHGVFLKKFYQIDPQDPFFDDLREDYSEAEPSFDEWFTYCAKAGDMAIVRYTDGVLDSFMAIKAEAKKIHLQDGCAKWAPRFKIRYCKFKNVSIFSACMVAYCHCTQLLQSEFKQSYITLLPKYEKMRTILCKHMNFREIGYTLGGEKFLLRDNSADVPILRASTYVYKEEVLPVVLKAINDALCSYYASMNAKVIVGLGPAALKHCV